MVETLLIHDSMVSGMPVLAIKCCIIDKHVSVREKMLPLCQEKLVEESPS